MNCIQCFYLPVRGRRRGGVKNVILFYYPEKSQYFMDLFVCEFSTAFANIQSYYGFKLFKYLIDINKYKEIFTNYRINFYIRMDYLKGR